VDTFFPADLNTLSVLCKEELSELTLEIESKPVSKKDYLKVFKEAGDVCAGDS
jgi:hypothetical protein